MPLLDIDRGIQREDVQSRFRLVNLASQRGGEINLHKEGTAPLQCTKYAKTTTNALEEIISKKISFTLEDK